MIYNKSFCYRKMFKFMLIVIFKFRAFSYVQSLSGKSSLTFSFKRETESKPEKKKKFIWAVKIQGPLYSESRKAEWTLYEWYRFKSWEGRNLRSSDIFFLQQLKARSACRVVWKLPACIYIFPPLPFICTYIDTHTAH